MDVPPPTTLCQPEPPEEIYRVAETERMGAREPQEERTVGGRGQEHRPIPPQIQLVPDSPPCNGARPGLSRRPQVARILVVETEGKCSISVRERSGVGNPTGMEMSTLWHGSPQR